MHPPRRERQDGRDDNGNPKNHEDCRAAAIARQVARE
jgi:hypothetical protein